MDSFSVLSHSINDTLNYGAYVAKNCKDNVIILLQGDLGTGKTTFVRGLADGFGVKIKANSPSFNLLNIYKGNEFTVYHIDAYRENFLSWDSLMLDDIICEPFCCVIEWPEHFFDLPAEYLQISINFKIQENSRLVTFDIKNEEKLTSFRSIFE